MIEQFSQPDLPQPDQRIIKLVSYGLAGTSGAVIGGVTGGTFAGEAANPGAVAERNDLHQQANGLRADVNKEEAALNLLDDVLQPTDPIIVGLKDKIATDQTQINSLTTTANNLNTGTDLDPTGIVAGAAVGAVFFMVASRYLARTNSRIRFKD